MIVDVHAHYFPEPFLQFAAANGLTGSTAPLRPQPRFVPANAGQTRPQLRPEDLQRRFGAMAEAGVGRQILSSPIAPYLDDQAAADVGARLLNDAYAELAAQHPDRLAFWATLPLPHVDASLREIDRAYSQLGAAGITLQCFCQNETIVREAFDPLFEELDRRGSVVFLHPCQNGICSHLLNEWGLTTCAGASLEDTVVALHLISQRIPSRFPRIRFIVPHLGGILPVLLERLDGQLPQTDLPERPSVTARRFFYDTVGWGSKPALVAAHMAFGATQLLPGSDWPFLLGWESYKQTFEHIRQADLPAESVERILERNAPELLGYH